MMFTVMKTYFSFKNRQKTINYWDYEIWLGSIDNKPSIEYHLGKTSEKYP